MPRAYFPGPVSSVPWQCLRLSHEALLASAVTQAHSSSEKRREWRERTGLSDSLLGRECDLVEGERIKCGEPVPSPSPGRTTEVTSAHSLTKRSAGLEEG